MGLFCQWDHYLSCNFANGFSSLLILQIQNLQLLSILNIPRGSVIVYYIFYIKLWYLLSIFFSLIIVKYDFNRQINF